MDRQLEQRLNRNYRFQRHVYDVSREYYLLGRDRLIHGLNPPEGGSILEVGCGTARNLMRAAERHPTAHLFGVDLSNAMLDTARRKLSKHAARDRIMLAHGDAATFDPGTLFARKQFDRVFFSYALSMIPPWQAAMGRAAQCVAPGGALHIIDFGNGHGLPAIANRGLRAWLTKFHVEPRDDLMRELRRINTHRNGCLTSSSLYGDYAMYAVLQFD